VLPSRLDPVLRLVRALGGEILDLLAPRECTACAAPHPTDPKDVAPPIFCATCANSLVPADDPPPGVVVPYAHGGALAVAIHRAKYGKEPLFASALGNLLASALRDSEALSRAECVVAVPLHSRRLASRGFNQAVEIARGLSLPMVYGAISRIRDTPSQVGRSRQERIANVAGAFALNKSSQLAGRHVLVVDDVVTTGATLTQVALAVQLAAPASVTPVALARAPLESTST
jgi:ComF family protein